MYDTITMPTDGSEVAEAASDHAIDLAEQYGATLHVVFVVDEGAARPAVEYASGSFGGDLRQDILTGLEEQGSEFTARIAEQAKERGIETVTTVLRSDTPHDGIVEYAEDNGADLLVMGTHGRSGVSRYVLGSVAESVVRHTDVPTLLVHG